MMWRYAQFSFWVVMGFGAAFIASVNIEHFVPHNPDYEFNAVKIVIGVIVYVGICWKVCIIAKETT